MVVKTAKMGVRENLALRLIILSQYTFILFGDYPVHRQVLFQELLL